MSEDPRRDDPKTSTTVIAGVIGIVLLVVLLVGLQTLYYRSVEAENRRKVAENPSAEELRIREAQLERLSSYRWIDRRQGVVAIPIDRAMQLLVEEGARPRPGAGGAVAR